MKYQCYNFVALGPLEILAYARLNVQNLNNETLLSIVLDSTNPSPLPQLFLTISLLGPTQVHGGTEKQNC